MSIQMYLAKLMRRAGQMHGPHGRAFVVRMSEIPRPFRTRDEFGHCPPAAYASLSTSMRRTPGSKGYMPDGSSLKAVQFPPLNKETVLDRILERPHTVEGIALHLEVVLIRFREDAGGKYCVTVVDEDLD